MGNSGPFGETTSVPDNTFSRGHLPIGPAGGSCTLCDTNSKYEIIDRTGDELMQVYEELAYKPEAAVYAEVLGRKGMRPEEGTKQLTILQLLHAAVETRGCAEDLHGLSFRAAGIQVGAAAQLIEFICNTTGAA